MPQIFGGDLVHAGILKESANIAGKVIGKSVAIYGQHQEAECDGYEAGGALPLPGRRFHGTFRLASRRRNRGPFRLTPVFGC